MTAPVLYARVLASFAAGMPPAAIDAVIELARSLGAELQAVLLEDDSSLALAELPMSRTFDPRQAVWRDVQRAQLLQELDLAASALRRRLESAQSSGMRTAFSVVRGGFGPLLEQCAQAGDLLVVTEPADPMARWVQPFAGLLGAALATPAAVLYLPPRGRKHDAPVAALGNGAAAELARRLAQSLTAPLVVLRAAEADLRSALPRLREQRVRVVVCDRAALGPDPRRALQEAGDQRLAVLVTPAAAA